MVRHLGFSLRFPEVALVAKGVCYMSSQWVHILANPALFCPCVSNFFLSPWYWSHNFLSTLVLGYIPFFISKIMSEIDPAHPQNCYCYDGIYEFIDSCYRQNYYPAPFSHSPELFVTCDQNFQFLPLTHSFSSLTSACTIPCQLSHTIHPPIHTVCELTPSIDPLNVWSHFWPWSCAMIHSLQRHSYKFSFSSRSLNSSENLP